MIEVDRVKQTPREMRPVYGAWPGVRAWNFGVRGWSLAMLLLILGVSFSLSGPDATLWIEACVIALVVGLLVLGLLANRHINRLNQASPVGGAESRWILDVAGVRILSPLTEQALDWRAIVRVVEEGDRFIFAVTPTRSHVLPVRCLGPGQLEAVRSMIADVTNSGRLGRGVD